jgi:predicted dehydrogenase
MSPQGDASIDTSILPGHVNGSVSSIVANGEQAALAQVPVVSQSRRPRIIFVGAGSQGHAYAGPITRMSLGDIIGICEPIPWKRTDFGTRYIWKNKSPLKHHQFQDWQSFVKYETQRRELVQSGQIVEGDDEFPGVDAAFICVLDEMHKHVIKALAPLGIHMMCEKPLATTLDDCTSIYSAMKQAWTNLGRPTIFGIGHVLRYSPRNMMLRQLVRDEKIVGDIISVEHTEPVGWWHMAHSFIR